MNKKEKCSLMYDNSRDCFSSVPFHRCDLGLWIMTCWQRMPRTIRIAQIAIIANSNFRLPSDKWRATSLQFGSDVLLCCRPFGPLLRIGAISHSLLSRSRSRINPDRRKKGRKGGQCKNYTTLSTAEHHPPPCCTHTETAKGEVSLHNFVSHPTSLQGFKALS